MSKFDLLCGEKDVDEDRFPEHRKIIADLGKWSLTNGFVPISTGSYVTSLNAQSWKVEVEMVEKDGDYMPIYKLVPRE